MFRLLHRRRVALAHTLVLLAIELRPSPPLVVERGDNGVCQLDLLLAVLVLVVSPLTLGCVGRVVVPVLDVARLGAGGRFGLFVGERYFRRHGVQLDGEVVDGVHVGVGITGNVGISFFLRRLRQPRKVLAPVNPRSVFVQEAFALVHNRIAVYRQNHAIRVDDVDDLLRDRLGCGNLVRARAVGVQGGGGRNDGDLLAGLYRNGPLKVEPVEAGVLKVAGRAVEHRAVGRGRGAVVHPVDGEGHVLVLLWHERGDGLDREVMRHLEDVRRARDVA